MGYAGSVTQMIQSIRNNKMLLNRRLKNESTQSTKLEFKKVDSLTLQSIKNRIHEKYQLNKRKAIIYTVSSLAIGVIGIFWLGNYINKNVILKDSQLTDWSNERILKEEQKALMRYEYCISDGFKWLNENNFHNAIFQLNKAIELQPDSYQANVGLCKALVKKCSIQNEDCDIAKDLMNKIELQFPEKKPISSIISSYLLEIGDTTLSQ